MDLRYPDNADPIRDGVTDADVIVGRGCLRVNHVGSQRYYRMVHQRSQAYEAATKQGKTAISTALVERVNRNGGRFLRRNRATGRWHEMHAKRARLKVAQAFRDVLRLDRMNSRNAPRRTIAAPPQQVPALVDVGTPRRAIAAPPQQVPALEDVGARRRAIAALPQPQQVPALVDEGANNVQILDLPDLEVDGLADFAFGDENAWAPEDIDAFLAL